jgi:hypothetical protein
MVHQVVNWAWTLFDPTELEIGKLKNDHDGIRYIVWQEETCPNTGRFHLQGYVQFEKKAVMSTAKKIMFGDKNHRVHLEVEWSNPDRNKIYCSKENTRCGPGFEWGVMSRQGQSRHLADVATAVSKGEMTMTEVMETAPDVYVMHHRGLENLAVQMMPDRDRDQAPEVYWYYGGTGTGKTRKVYDDNPDVYTWSGTWPWFHGYRGETTVLFDDFRGTIPFNQLLRLLDRYPCTVETKGGFMKWRATKIYVTSALKPEDCYDKEKFHADDHIAQLLRRITDVVVFRQLNM